MYTNPNIYGPGTLVNATKLNADARDNINAIYSLVTESMLNPSLGGSAGWPTEFPIDIVSISGEGFVVGSFGVENTVQTQSLLNTEWRVMISYTMATNSNSGTNLAIKSRYIGNAIRPHDPGTIVNSLFACPTITSQGRYFHVSPWEVIPTDTFDPVYSLSVVGNTADFPFPPFSDISITVQTRDTSV